VAKLDFRSHQGRTRGSPLIWICIMGISLYQHFLLLGCLQLHLDSKTCPIALLTSQFITFRQRQVLFMLGFTRGMDSSGHLMMIWIKIRKSILSLKLNQTAMNPCSYHPVACLLLRYPLWMLSIYNLTILVE
jgi:hypothetical protein